MTTVILEKAEVAVLLALSDANSIYGSDPAALFPDNEDDLQALYKRGSQALQEHGWMVLEGNRYRELNVNLLLLAATVSSPDQVILTRRYFPDGVQEFGHYISGDLVVEYDLTTDQKHRFVFLEDIDLVVARIGGALGIDQQPANTHLTISISPAQLKEAVDLAQAGDSIAFSAMSDRLGVNGNYIDSLMDALAAPMSLTVVEVVNAVNAQEVESKNIFMFSSGSINWLLQTNGSDLVILNTPKSEAFARVMQKNLAELTTR